MDFCTFVIVLVIAFLYNNNFLIIIGKNIVNYVKKIFLIIIEVIIALWAVSYTMPFTIIYSLHSSPCYSSHFQFEF